MSSSEFMRELWALTEEMQRQGNDQLALLHLLGALQRPELCGFAPRLETALDGPRSLAPSPPPRDLTTPAFPPYARQEELRTRLKLVTLLVEQVELAFDHGGLGDKSTAVECMDLATQVLAPLFVRAYPHLPPNASALLSSENFEDGPLLLKRRRLESGVNDTQRLKEEDSDVKLPFTWKRPEHTRSGFLSVAGDTWDQMENDFFLPAADVTALSWSPTAFALQLPRGWPKWGDNGAESRTAQIVLVHESPCHAIHRGTNPFGGAPSERATCLPFRLLLEAFLLRGRLFRLQKNFTAALDVLDRTQRKIAEAFSDTHWHRQRRRLEMELKTRMTCSCADPSQCCCNTEQVADACFCPATRAVWERMLDSLWSYEKKCAQLLLSAEYCRTLLALLQRLRNPIRHGRYAGSATMSIRREKDILLCLALLDQHSSICCEVDRWFQVTKNVWEPLLTRESGTGKGDDACGMASGDKPVQPEREPDGATSFSSSCLLCVKLLQHTSQLDCTCLKVPIPVIISPSLEASATSSTTFSSSRSQIHLEGWKSLLLSVRGCLDPVCLSSWSFRRASSEMNGNDQRSYVGHTALDVSGLLRQLAMYNAYAICMKIPKMGRESSEMYPSPNTWSPDEYAAAVYPELQRCASIGSRESHGTVKEQRCETASGEAEGSEGVDELEIFQSLYALSDYGRLPVSLTAGPSMRGVYAQSHWTSKRWRDIVKSFVDFLICGSTECDPHILTKIAPRSNKREGRHIYAQLLNSYASLVQSIDVEMMELSEGAPQSSYTASGGAELFESRQESLNKEGCDTNRRHNTPIPFLGLVSKSRYSSSRLSALTFLVALKSSTHLQMAASSLRHRLPLECVQCLVEWRHCLQVFATPLAPMRTYGHVLIAVLALQMGLTDVPLKLRDGGDASSGADPTIVEFIRGNSRFGPQSSEQLCRDEAGAGELSDVSEEEWEIAHLVGLPYYHLLAAEASATATRHFSSCSTSLTTSSPAFLLRVELLKLCTIYVTASTRARLAIQNFGSHQTDLCSSDNTLLGTCGGHLRVSAHASLASQKKCRESFASKIASLLRRLEEVDDATHLLGSSRLPTTQHERKRNVPLTAQQKGSAAAWTPFNRCMVHLLYGLYAASEEHDPFLARREFQVALDTLSNSMPNTNEEHGRQAAEERSSSFPFAWFTSKPSIITLLRGTLSHEGTTDGYESALEAALLAMSPPERSDVEEDAKVAVANPTSGVGVKALSMERLHKRWRAGVVQMCGGASASTAAIPSPPNVAIPSGMRSFSTNPMSLTMLHSIMSFLPGLDPV